MIEHALIIATGNPNHHSMLTYNRVHAMLPALGKPLVARIMDRLYRAGIRRYTVIVGESDGAVASYLNDSWVPDAKIDFILRFGNDSLLKLFRSFSQKYQYPFIVCNYNCFTHIHFTESLIKQHQDFSHELVLSAASSTLSKSQQQYYALMDGHKVDKIIKSSNREANAMALINLAVCGQSMVNWLSASPSKPINGEFSWEFMDIAQHFISSGGESVLAETAWTLQVDTDRDLITLNKHLLDEGQDAHILSEIPYTVRIIPPVRIDPQVSIGQGSKIGPHVYLERGCTIGRDVSLRNTIVLGKANVPAEKQVADSIISTRGPIT